MSEPLAIDERWKKKDGGLIATARSLRDSVRVSETSDTIKQLARAALEEFDLTAARAWLDAVFDEVDRIRNDPELNNIADHHLFQLQCLEMGYTAELTNKACLHILRVELPYLSSGHELAGEKWREYLSAPRGFRIDKRNGKPTINRPRRKKCEATALVA